MNETAVTIEVSSGNVFADLELPDADELLVKADLAIAIVRAIEARGLKQAEAARLLGINQPKVSALIRGHLEGFSIERLFRFLRRLQQNILIVVSPTHGPLNVGLASVHMSALDVSRLETEAVHRDAPQQNGEGGTAASRPSRRRRSTRVSTS